MFLIISRMLAKVSIGKKVKSMNTISGSGYQNLLSVYLQKSNQVSGNQGQTKSEQNQAAGWGRDSMEISLEAVQALQDLQTTKKIDPLDSLVADGTITEEQKEAIKTALEAAGPPPPPGTTEDKGDFDPLESLVNDGTITEEQKEMIKEALKASDPPPKREMDEENNVDPLDSLVADGTITEDQQEAIKSALMAARPFKFRNE